MNVDQVIQIGRELMITAVVVSAPVIGISLLVGVFIAVLQTITSIQEQTLSLAPRIVAVAVMIVATLPWTLQVLMGFSYRMMWRIAEVGH